MSRDEKNSLKRIFMALGYSMFENSPYNIEYNEFMPAHIKVIFPKNQKPTDEQLLRVLDKAKRMEWQTLYVFGANKKKPDTETIMRLQKLAAQHGFNQFKICADPAEYQAIGSIRNLHQMNKQQFPHRPFIRCTA